MARPRGYGPERRPVNAWIAGVAALLVGILPIVSRAEGDHLRLLLLGDSLTAGYGLERSKAFPAQLERALRADGIEVTVIDAGVSGDTTTGGRARLEWLLAGPAEDRPDAVIVELGGNDALRGIDPALTAANLDAILTELRANDLPVLLAGMMAPPNLGDAYRTAFDAIYPDLAEKHDAALYPFFLEGVAARPALNQPDGIHPNADGVAVIVESIVPAVKRLLERAQDTG